MYSESGLVLINGSEAILNMTVTLNCYTKILNERLNWAKSFWTAKAS